MIETGLFVIFLGGFIIWQAWWHAREMRETREEHRAEVKAIHAQYDKLCDRLQARSLAEFRLPEAPPADLLRDPEPVDPDWETPSFARPNPLVRMNGDGEE